MPYATASDIELALGDDYYALVADRDVDGVVDTDAVDRAIASATSQVDSYLGPWLPLPSVPPMVQEATIAIAVHRLRVHRDATTEDSRRAYDGVVAWLRDVSSGKASIGLPTPPSEGPGEVIVESSPRVFTRDSLRRVM